MEGEARLSLRCDHADGWAPAGWLYPGPSLCSIGKTIPSPRPGFRQAPRAGAVKDAHRAPRSGARRASLTVPSTVLNSRQEGRSASCCLPRRAPGYHPHVPYQFLPDVEKTRLLLRRSRADAPGRWFHQRSHTRSRHQPIRRRRSFRTRRPWPTDESAGRPSSSSRNPPEGRAMALQHEQSREPPQQNVSCWPLSALDLRLFPEQAGRSAPTDHRAIPSDP